MIFLVHNKLCCIWNFCVFCYGDSRKKCAATITDNVHALKSESYTRSILLKVRPLKFGSLIYYLIKLVTDCYHDDRHRFTTTKSRTGSLHLLFLSTKQKERLEWFRGIHFRFKRLKGKGYRFLKQNERRPPVGTSCTMYNIYLSKNQIIGPRSPTPMQNLPMMHQRKYFPPIFKNALFYLVQIIMFSAWKLSVFSLLVYYFFFFWFLKALLDTENRFKDLKLWEIPVKIVNLALKVKQPEVSLITLSGES